MKKHIIKIAAFLVGFLLINLLLCGFMPPDNGSSLAMWRNYHSKDSVDIAVIGSSLASCALPEDELAAATGKSVALMATNSKAGYVQNCTESCCGNIHRSMSSWSWTCTI